MATILIVDDNATNRQVLTTLLGYGQHRLIEATDGAEGLEKTHAERPDLIITDIVMPTMDGFEFVRQLRSDPALTATPVIFYTAAYHEREARNLARACGVQQVLTKPTEPAAILSAIDAALGLASQPPPPPPPAEAFDREHLRTVTDKLAQKVEELETANLRLNALIEVGRQFALQRDPKRLIEMLCKTAREVVGARYAGVGIPDEAGEKLVHLFLAGMDAETSARLGPMLASSGLLRGVTKEGRPRAIHGLRGDPTGAGLPSAHPPVDVLLVTPIASPTQVYGWLYLADKLGAEAFGAEDERLTATLAGQLAVAYENTLRYEQLQDRTVELENAIQELESFSYSVAHDLRAPLRGVIGYAVAMVEDYGKTLDAEGMGFLNTIRDSAREMGQLIDDLLAFSRIGRQQMALSEVNVAALARSVFEEAARAAPERRLELEMGDLPPARGDRAMVRQVLANLLSNAVKFTRDRETAQIEVGIFARGRENVYYVRDNGAGFDMKYVDKLFGVFQRLHGADEFEGTGIGLSIVRRVVHRHGGRVWAEGEAGRGATFYFTLPPAEGGDHGDV